MAGPLEKYWTLFADKLGCGSLTQHLQLCFIFLDSLLTIHFGYDIAADASNAYEHDNTEDEHRAFSITILTVVALGVLLIAFIAIVMMVVHLGSSSVVIVVAIVGRVSATRLILPATHFDI